MMSLHSVWTSAFASDLRNCCAQARGFAELRQSLQTDNGDVKYGLSHNATSSREDWSKRAKTLYDTRNYAMAEKVFVKVIWCEFSSECTYTCACILYRSSHCAQQACLALALGINHGKSS